MCVITNWFYHMKRSPNTPTEEGIFIALVYQTVASNVPAIARLKAKSDSLKEFIVENRKEIATAIARLYQEKGDISPQRLNAITGLLVGTIRETTNNVWLAGFGLQSLIECTE